MFRTYEPTRDRLVAVKVFRLDLTPEQAASLADELSRATQAGLFHPSIVEPVAAGVEGTVAYRAEEYVAAESLDVAMRHYAPATLEKALPFITQLAAAIDFARAAGVGHGALHPRDIFVTPDEARATGFGVVDALERLGQRAPVRRPYSPPERIAGSEWGSPADVFSLAVIAFELLTGRRPSGIGEQMGTLSGAALGDRADAIKAVLAKAMDESAAARHQSAGAFAAALAEAAGNPSLAVGAAEVAAVTGEPRLLASDDAAIERDEIGRDHTDAELLDDFAPDAPSLEADESPREAARKAIAARKRLMKDKPAPAAPVPAASSEIPPRVEVERRPAADRGSEAAPPVADSPLPLSAAMEPGAAVDLEASPIASSGAGEPVSVPVEEPQAPAPVIETPVASSPVKPRTREPRAKKHDREHLFKPLELPVAPPLPDVAPAIDRLAPEAVMPPVDGESIEPRREEPRIDVPLQVDAEPVTDTAKVAKEGAVADVDEPVHPGLLAGGLDVAPASPVREVDLAAYPSEAPAHVDEPLVRARGDDAMTDAPLLRDVSERVVAVDEFRARESASPRGDRAWPRLSGRPPLDRSLASNPSPIEPSEPAEQPPMFGVEEPRRDRSPRAMLPYAVPLIVGLLLGYMVRDFIGDRNQAREAATVSDTGTPPSQTPGIPGTSGQSPATPATETVVTPSTAAPASTPPPATGAPGAAPPSTTAAAKDTPRRDPPSPAKPAAAPRTGTIVVNSNPSKAGVTINGRWMGRTPLRLRGRRFGKYSVRVVQPGFEVEREDFSLSATAATKTIDVNLKRQPSKTSPKPAAPAAAATQKPGAAPAATTGAIFVDSRPQGARVLIDGREVGVTPFRLPGVPVGSYAVRLELVDHTPWTATAKVAAGETARVTGSLDRIR